MRIFAFIIGLCFCLPVQAADNIGAVERTRGEATAIRGQVAHDLSQGSAVVFRDLLRTGQQSRLQVSFIDGSSLTLGDDAELSIDEMVYEPKTKGRAVLRLTQGVFRMVSGKINKVPGGSLTIQTPLATIGVRGTDFWGQQTQDTLLMALLDRGELTIETADGTVKLSNPLHAVKVQKGEPLETFILTPEQLKSAVKTVAW
ncbi:MAG: FecR family protein [Magnetovibrio sp.]|nr:FecR family protein [Magnetovibrio sp.]